VSIPSALSLLQRKGGEELHAWFHATRTFKRLFGDTTGGTTGTEDDFAKRGLSQVEKDAVVAS
jgi:hypothetical protein